MNQLHSLETLLSRFHSMGWIRYAHLSFSVPLIGPLLATLMLFPPPHNHLTPHLYRWTIYFSQTICEGAGQNGVFVIFLSAITYLKTISHGYLKPMHEPLISLRVCLCQSTTIRFLFRFLQMRMEIQEKRKYCIVNNDYNTQSLPL